MTTAMAFENLTSDKACDLCRNIGLSKEARGLLNAHISPEDYFAALMEAQLHADAIRFLAQALPKHEAVRWAHRCVREVLGDEADEAANAALEAAERWLDDPTDDHSRAAFTAAEAAGLGTPAGCVATAAYFSGGSLAPAGVQPVPPVPYLTGGAVAGALLLAATLRDPELAEQKHAHFLRLGIELASGGQ